MTAEAATARRMILTRLTSAISRTGRPALEALALGAGAASFVVVALVAWLTFGSEATRPAGPGSLGEFVALSSGFVAFVAFALGRYADRSRNRAHRVTPLDVFDAAALAAAHGSIAQQGWTLLAVVLEQSFIGAEVFAIPTLLVGGATAAVTAYVVFSSATHLDPQSIAVVLALFAVGGVVVSMLTASDPGWWRDDLSALGNTQSFSSPTFNLTLVLAGVLVTTLARRATATLTTSHPRGLRRVRFCWTVAGVFLALVGVFPVDAFHAIHTGFASGMVIVFATLVICLPWWIPETPRAFVWLGWTIVAAILFLAGLFASGYYTLTAVELVVGILVFSWIILFVRTQAALVVDARSRPPLGKIA